MLTQIYFFIGKRKNIFCFFKILKSVGIFYPTGPYNPINSNILSVLQIYASRPFQRAIVELIKRQGSKVIEGTTDPDERQTDDKVKYKAVFFQKRTKKKTTHQREKKKFVVDVVDDVYF
jgi:hypothetical protein